MPFIPHDIQLLILESADWDQQPLLARVCKSWRSFLISPPRTSPVFLNRYVSEYQFKYQSTKWLRPYDTDLESSWNISYKSPLLHRAILSITHLVQINPDELLTACHIDADKLILETKDGTPMRSTQDLDLKSLGIKFPDTMFLNDPFKLEPPYPLPPPPPASSEDPKDEAAGDRLWAINPQVNLQVLEGPCRLFGEYGDPVHEPMLKEFYEGIGRITSKYMLPSREKVWAIEIASRGECAYPYLSIGNREMCEWRKEMDIWIQDVPTRYYTSSPSFVEYSDGSSTPPRSEPMDENTPDQVLS